MFTDNLYREEILEHYHSPQNFGVLKTFDVTSRQLNPFCGDEIEMFIKFKPQSPGVATIPPRGWNSLTPKEKGQNTRIQRISFLGKGCAISIASASLLTEYAKGKTKSQLTKFSQHDMLSLLGVEVSHTRKKCALLALSVLKDCIA